VSALLKPLKTRCNACGSTDTATLEFAHFDASTKTRSKTTGRRLSLGNLKSVGRIQKELPLGRFLCANCHAIETRGEFAPIEEYVKALQKHAVENAKAVFYEKQKRGGCVDCGLSFIDSRRYLFEFDHRDPTQKSFSMKNVIRQAYDPDVLKAEMAKCDLRCRNCHRKRTLRQIAEKKKNKKRKIIEVE
jgi:hypothetical protein